MTIQNSVQYAAAVAIPPTKVDAALSYGKARVYQIQFTQVGSGSIGSTLRLLRLPAGKVAVYGYQSYLANSAFGASCTLALGYAQYRNKDGNIVTASTAALDAATAVATAGIIQLGRALDATAGGVLTLETIGGFTLIGTIAGAVIPNAATLNGAIVIGVE